MNRMVTIILAAALAAAPLAPSQAVALATDDVLRVPASEQPFVRYVWTGNDRQAHGALEFTVNSALSHATTLVPSRVVAGGELVRINLASLAPRDADLKRLIETWEGLDVAEPYFHTVRIVASKPYTQGGKTWTGKRVAELALHTGLDKHLLLASLTQSRVPIVRADWFIVRALSTANGGRYYEFRGTEKSDAKNTAFDKWLAKSGTSEKLVESLRSDERAAMTFSGVTSRARRVDMFAGAGVRLSQGTPLVTITHDISNADVAAETDPIKNLLNFKDRAREAFRTLPTGLIEMGLFDGKGELQDFVPQDIAHDSTIPTPFNQTLEGFASCVACHAGEDMFRSTRNDVMAAIKARGGDVFDDLKGKAGTADTLDRLAGLYSGDLMTVIRQARTNFSMVVYRMTGGMSVPDVGGKIASIRNEYAFSMVTPAKACRELGFDATDANASEVFATAVPPLPKDANGFTPEGAFAVMLRGNVPITRIQWEQDFSDFALRAETARRIK